MDAPEWIQLAQDGHGQNGGFWTNAAATEDSPKYYREDLVMALVKALEQARPYVDCAVHDDGGIDYCEIGYRIDLETIDGALAWIGKGYANA